MEQSECKIIQGFSYRKYLFVDHGDIVKATKIYLDTEFPDGFEAELGRQEIKYKRES